MFAIVYTVVLSILAIITFIFSFQGFRKKKILGKLLGVISIIIVISNIIKSLFIKDVLWVDKND